jgi:hypothetical protein
VHQNLEVFQNTRAIESGCSFIFLLQRQRPGSTHPGSFAFDHHTISDLKLPATEEEEEKTTQETKGK